MENRRVLLAVLLSMVVIIAWQLLVQPVAPPPGAEPEPSWEEPARATEAGAEEGEVPGERAEPAEGAAARPEEESPSAGEASQEAVAEEPIFGERERVSVLEGERVHAEVSNRGAKLVSLHLPGYVDPEGGEVELVRPRSEGPHPFTLVDELGRPLPLDDVLFAVDEGLDEAGNPTVELAYRGPEGEVTKRFTLLPNGLLDVSIEARGPEAWGVAVGPGLREPTERDEARWLKYRGAVYLAGGDMETIGADDLEEVEGVSGSGLRWIGVEDTYFLSVLVPRAPVERAVVRPYRVTTGESGRARMEPAGIGALEEPAEGERSELGVAVFPRGSSFRAAAFFGSKDLERLSALELELEDTVRLGMFGVVAKPLLTGLKWIYAKVVPNYGWAIVLMTVLIKLVLLPLTHKSYVSMQKMQELAPKIKAIRNKYQGKLRDKKGRPDIEQQRKMNEEVQAVYRAEGVNPAGGCVPLLLQFPVLIAFYRLLSNAVELRDAPWILWIHDLSVRDPIYVLPLVMGGMQFLQQKMAPSAAEPMQRRMMMAMPLVFTVLFLKAPSGLVLYWLTNNVLTVIQQGAYHRTKARAAAGE